MTPREQITAELGEGAGTELAIRLHSFYLRSDDSCECKPMARKMNEWGPMSCLAHMDEILDCLEREAIRRGLPFSALVARMCVLKSIARARRNERRSSRGL